MVSGSNNIPVFQTPNASKYFVKTRREKNSLKIHRPFMLQNGSISICVHIMVLLIYSGVVILYILGCRVIRRALQDYCGRKKALMMLMQYHLERNNTFNQAFSQIQLSFIVFFPTIFSFSQKKLLVLTEIK